MVLHSDQGSIYASKSYNDLLPIERLTYSLGYLTLKQYKEAYALIQTHI